MFQELGISGSSVACFYVSLLKELLAKSQLMSIIMWGHFRLEQFENDKKELSWVKKSDFIFLLIY